MTLLFSCKTLQNNESTEITLSDTMLSESSTGVSSANETLTEWPKQHTQKSIYNNSKKILTDLIHTKLEISFDWKKAQLIGKAIITAKPHFYSSDKIILDAKGMEIKMVMMAKTPLKYDYDGKKLKINLGKKYKKEEVFEITINYISNPNEIETTGGIAIMSDKGLYFVNSDGKDSQKMPQIWTQGETESNSVWFPTIDSPNSKTSQEILITVEDKFKTLSNGNLISSTKNEDGKRTDHWKQEKQHAPYLFMLAVGEFVEVKDFYIRPDGSKMRVNYFVEKEYAPYAKNIFGETPKMIAFFSELLGVPYPWDKYDQVVVRDFVSGAMENTGAVIFGDFVYKTDKELLDGNDQSTIAHELFHHWFGDLVTCESWANLSLNESFANYSQYLWDEHRYGKDEADYQAQQEANGYFGSAKYKGYHDLIWYSYTNKDDVFDSHSYNKGGRILHMLRAYVGDEAFFASLQLYLKQNAYKATEHNHLRLAFEEITGEDLNWFFNQWYMDKGHPVIEIYQKTNKEKKKVTLSIHQKQKSEYPVFKLPVEVLICDEMGQRTEKIFLDKKHEEFEFSYSGRLKNLLFDKNQVLLAHVYHEKPSESYIYQYYNSASYKARKKGLRIGEKKNSVFSYKMILDALSDPFWDIKIEAMSLIYKLPEKQKKQAIILLKKISQSDKKSIVRKKALEVLAENLHKEDLVPLCNNRIEKDSSYLVVIEALEKAAEVDPQGTLLKAKLLEKTKSKTLLIGIAKIYATHGEEETFSFFEKCLLNGSLYGAYHELDMISYLMDFVVKKDLFYKKELYKVFKHLKTNASGYTKQYMQRLIDYIINYIEDEIVELEKSTNKTECLTLEDSADNKIRLIELQSRRQEYKSILKN